MRKKRNTRSDILIDLTSLLDVIFIILLVVLCGQNQIKSELSESQLTANNAQARAEAMQDIYKDMQDIADNINKFVVVASVSVPYNKSEIRKREIIVQVDGEEEPKSFLLNGLDTDEAFNKFENLLVGYIKENSERPVILSLNEEDDKILYRDEVAINKVYDKLSNEFDNVYIKKKLGEDSQ